jgi:hypothetical protein
MKKSLALIATALFALAAPSAHAYTLTWGASQGSLFYNSQGALLDKDYFFDIGTFANGFIPDSSNLSQWEANWKVIDRAVSNDPTGLQTLWNPSTSEITNGDNVINALGQSDSDYAISANSFQASETMYLWVFNSKSIIPGSEWALLYDDTEVAINNAASWFTVAPSATFDPTYAVEDLDRAVFGGAQGQQYAGGFSATPSAFLLQTAVVPEPGSCLLLAASGLALSFRRRRMKSIPLV